MIKVSVIIPVYNVQAYIERCARSLFEQSLQDLEYIFVDDCSPDNSISLLKRLLLDYPNRAINTIICRHTCNKGLPQARKTGVLKARGEYVAFCDSDDWVSPEIYERLYTEALRKNADLVSCDFYRTDGTNNRNYFSCNNTFYGPVWNRLIKRSVFHNPIQFPKYNKAEDGVLMIQLSYFCNIKVFLHEALYYYFINLESISLKPSKEACIKRWEEESENVEQIINFVRSYGIEDQLKEVITKFKYYANKNLLPYIDDKEIFELWSHSFPELSYELLFKKRIPLKMKCVQILCKLHLMPLVNKLFKVYY